jgi:hypothetical protein
MASPQIAVQAQEFACTVRETNIPKITPLRATD